MDTWIQYSPNVDRSTLVFVGTDSDRSPMYVGRGNHSCDLIPGKLLTSTHRCHVSYDGQEFSLESFEVLVNANYIWIPCSDGSVPANAVIGGRTNSGESLYVGRANHNGIVTSGKVHPSHRCLYLPFGWKEHSYKNYEVLVRQQNWCPPPVHPPTCPPTRPPCNCPVHPPHCPPTRPPCNCPPVQPPVCPPVQPPVCPPVQPPVCPPVQPPVCPPVQPPVCPPVQPPVCPPARPPICGIFRPHLRCARPKHGHKRC